MNHFVGIGRLTRDPMEFCDSKNGQQLSDAKEFAGAPVPDEDIPF